MKFLILKYRKGKNQTNIGCEEVGNRIIALEIFVRLLFKIFFTCVTFVR